MSIRLVIADDQEIIRAGLRESLSAAGIEILAEAETVSQAVDLSLQHSPEVAMLGVGLPGEGGGLGALEQIKSQRPDISVVMYSAFDNSTYIGRAVTLGAAAYVLKSWSLEELIATLRTAASGRSAWTQQQMRRAAAASTKPLVEMDVNSPLPAREVEVLRLLAGGMTNNQIAETLGISYETIKEHVQHILRKVGVTCRTQAAVWAVRNELA